VASAFGGRPTAAAASTAVARTCGRTRAARDVAKSTGQIGLRRSGPDLGRRGKLGGLQGGPGQIWAGSRPGLILD
jgi:hypothetical protein